MTRLYDYDIQSCHFNLMKHAFLPVNFLKSYSKLERNKKIGKIMRDYPNIKNFLRRTTVGIIDNFIFQNKIKPSDIILRQYDGLIIKKKIIENNQNENLNLILKNKIEIMIISIDLKKYIALTNTGKIIKKGFHYSTTNLLDEYYRKILKINYASKKSIFISLFKIQKHFLTEKNKNGFFIPLGELHPNQFLIFLKDYGAMEISKSTKSLINMDQLDLYLYFNYFFEPFIKSIIVQYI
jgi:hypothetical protein